MLSPVLKVIQGPQNEETYPKLWYLTWIKFELWPSESKSAVCLRNVSFFLLSKAYRWIKLRQKRFQIEHPPFYRWVLLDPASPTLAPACWEEIRGWCLKSNEFGPSLFIFQTVISATPSHPHPSRPTDPLGFWLFPSPASPTSPRVLPDTSPGSATASPPRPGWQDWNTSLAQQCPNRFALQKRQSWDHLQKVLGAPLPCSAPLPPRLREVPDQAAPFCPPRGKKKNMWFSHIWWWQVPPETPFPAPARLIFSPCSTTTTFACCPPGSPVGSIVPQEGDG